jgi:type VI secretion system protein ImpA
MHWERAVPLLRDDLLTPISGSNPCGENLRYDPLYDKIKEARTEDEDDAPQGEWQRARKKADFALVIKLARDALAKRSKDLQLVAWLGEAMLRREGWAPLPECISLFQQIQEQFWDGCYPPLEGGNPDLRCAPQEWFAARCDYILQRIPLTSNRLNRIQYQESRTVPSDERARENESTSQAREEAISQGKLTPEEWEAGFKATPKVFYEELLNTLDASLEAVASLDKFCDEKYGADGPSLGKLRRVLEEIKLTTSTLLAEKGGPDSAQTDVAESIGNYSLGSEAAGVSADTGAAAAPARAKSAVAWAEPASPEAAIVLVARAAEYLRKQDPTLVSPYLLLRSLRWGELRWQGDTLDEAFLASPSTETRQELRRLQRESAWEELLNITEATMATSSGRGWLDLQRYAWESCYNLSYSAVAKAICSETRALLQDYADMASMNLSDGTAAADKQTLEWIGSYVVCSQNEPEQPPEIVQYQQRDTSSENGHADYFEVAMQLAKAGRVADAIDGFSREAARESSGRDRFRRQLQLAQLCLSTQHFALAYPILQGLAQEIERRNLLEWEDSSLLSQVLAMLLQCIDRTTRDQQERGRVYGLLCRLGPAAALQFERS